MQKPPKAIIGIVVIVGIVVVGILVGWLGSTGSAPDIPPPLEVQPPVRAATQPLSTPLSAGLPALAEVASGTNPTTPITASFPEAAPTNFAVDWSDKLDRILGSEIDDTNKVKQLFALFPHLPEDGQTETAQHLSNLVSDEDYSPLGELLKNAKLPEEVLDTLLADALNRPNSVKLPALLDVARTPDHPKADEAKDLLELYLDEDYGTDWNQWRQKLQQWLKENPD